MTDQQQTAEVSTTNLPIKKRFRSFVIPRRIVIDDNLKRLSHDALRTYLFLAHKSYRQLDRDFVLSDSEINRSTGVPYENVESVKAELKAARLIDYRNVSKTVTMFMLVRDTSLWESKYTFSPVGEDQPESNGQHS
jgi:hypothetical protein